MPQIARIRQQLGKSGIAFLIAAVLLLVFYFTGRDGLFIVDLLVLIPLGAIVLFRAFRVVKRNSLWSLRNRLLFVYGLFGVLPVLLLLALFVILGWALMSELAIYLAKSALERHIDGVQDSIQTIKGIPVEARKFALVQVERAYAGAGFPGIAFYIKDSTGVHRFPPDSNDINVPAGWKNVHGLLVHDGRFYAFAHYLDQAQEITSLAPLSDEMVANLVPHLGVITLVTLPDSEERKALSVGSLHLDPNRADDMSGDLMSRIDSRMPAPMSRFDIPVSLPSTVNHFHLDNPNDAHPSVIWVHSRPSAVMRSFFSDSDAFRGIVADILIGIAILFLLVELAAVVIGVSLSRRITRSVNQLYEGTRRVIHGNFTHRIPVNKHDQLGDLASSFNQMTGNLERLLAVEKERERLQTELEIAREVQRQLYPREEPPQFGLKLTARCDPARMVSGDYYDYQMLPNNKIAFAIGDVAGKGISAALLMATIQAALRAQVSNSQPMLENECSNLPEIDAAVLVSKLNKQVYAHTAPEKYATFFFAVYDEATRALTYTNAGHLSPLMFRNGNVVTLDTNGLVVGAFPFAKYDASCITVEDNDLLVCYTDGITEPENAYGEMFGEERLIELVKKHRHADDHELIGIIFDAVRSWTGVPELSDDMTLLLARHVGAA